jgi:hypothetical protein
LGSSGGQAIIDSEPDESHDDEDEHDTIDGTSSIGQIATRPSSYLVGGYGLTITLRIGAAAEDSATSTLSCFPFGVCNGFALGLFVPVLILSTLAFGTASVGTLFGMTAFESTPAFSDTLTLDAALAFGTDFA